MAENLPYSTSVGTLEKMLEKIKSASVPERFTQDFVHTKLAMKGGTANACELWSRVVFSDLIKQRPD